MTNQQDTVWQGATPFGAEWAVKPHPSSKRPHLHGKIVGYNAAMNSPEVKAWYRATKQALDFMPMGQPETMILRQALAAYEVGLVKP